MIILYEFVQYQHTATQTIKILGSILTAPNKEEPDAEVKAQGIEGSLDYDVAVVASDNGWNFLQDKNKVFGNVDACGTEWWFFQMIMMQLILLIPR